MAPTLKTAEGLFEVFLPLIATVLEFVAVLCTGPWEVRPPQLQFRLWIGSDKMRMHLLQGAAHVLFMNFEISRATLQSR